MKKANVIQTIFQHTVPQGPQVARAEAFAPTNIALCKYWGKRDAELNLPVTSSLSISLPGKGATAQVEMHAGERDIFILNGQEVSEQTVYVERMRNFINLFRPISQWNLRVVMDFNIPVAAGLASSACGFASLVLALNKLCGWDLTARALSILARLGSGSACRSLWSGFVEWHAGSQLDGMDSYSEPLIFEWPELCVGVVTVNSDEKPISSREAMQKTMDTSVLYSAWPRKVAQDLTMIKQAIYTKHFALLGGSAESNALTMHATMLSSWPPICYFKPETISMMQKVWHLRNKDIPIYFTQDAGPNVKLLFLDKDQEIIKQEFPQVETIKPFSM